MRKEILADGNRLVTQALVCTPHCVDAAANRAQVAAFFDLDGTFLPEPSLEKRLFRMLRYRKRMRIANYLAWLREAARLLLRGINQMVQGNKAYLRGIDTAEQDFLALPPFFSSAVERVAWHAVRGHAIVLVSGTLEPLAKRAAGALEAELARRDIRASIEVSATRLESVSEKWTGRIVGDAMFGQTKAAEVARFCASRGIELSRCFVYGDSTHDRWMLQIVGRPAAVNPSEDLGRIARRNQWPILRWNETQISARTPQITRPIGRVPTNEYSGQS